MSAPASPLISLGDVDASYGAAGGQVPQIPYVVPESAPPAGDWFASGLQHGLEVTDDDVEGLMDFCCRELGVQAQRRSDMKPPSPGPSPKNKQMGPQAAQPPSPQLHASTIMEQQFQQPSTGPHLPSSPPLSIPMHHSLSPALSLHPSLPPPSHTPPVRQASGAVSSSPTSRVDMPDTVTKAGVPPPAPPSPPSPVSHRKMKRALTQVSKAAVESSKAGVPPSASASPAPSAQKKRRTSEVQDDKAMTLLSQTARSALGKVRAILGDKSFTLNREKCKELHKNPVWALPVFNVIHTQLTAIEKDVLLNETECIDTCGDPNANTSKNEWRNQWNYLSHLMRWIAAYARLSGLTLEEAAKDIQNTKGSSTFEIWKRRATHVLAPGTAMRMAWDKADIKSPDTDKRTRDRLEMIAAGAGSGLHVEL